MSEAGVSSSCSRSMSRAARTYVQRNVLEVGAVDALALPLDCPFHPLADPFREQESKFARLTVGQYQCLLCNKRFKSVMYMDRHMDRMHADKLLFQDSFCLADLCPVFGCDAPDVGAHKRGFNNLKMCRDSEVQDTRRACRAVMESCYPPSAPTAAWRDFFSKNLCDRINCQHGIIRVRSLLPLPYPPLALTAPVAQAPPMQVRPPVNVMWLGFCFAFFLVFAASMHGTHTTSPHSLPRAATHLHSQFFTSGSCLQTHFESKRGM